MGRIPGVLLAILVAMLPAACRRSEAPPEPPPLEVTAMPVVQRTIPLYLEHNATTEAVNTVEVRARVRGFLEKAPFKEGADVQGGDLLFVIEQEPYKAALAQAKAELARTLAARDIALRDFKRISSLATNDVASQAALDKARAARDEAIAGVEAAQAAGAKAELDLSYTEIRAPIAGRIGALHVDVGNLVGASGDTVLTTLVQLDPLYVSFGASERERLEVLKKRSQGAYVPRDQIEGRAFLADGSEHPYPGHVDFVDNTVDPTSGTVRVRLVFPNPEKNLLPGQYVKVLLFMGNDQQALLVPEQAVLSDQGGSFVFVVGSDGTLESRPVIPTSSHEGMRVIESGLRAGELVLVDNLQRARPGAKVIARAPQAVAADAAAGSESAPAQ